MSEKSNSEKVKVRGLLTSRIEKKPSVDIPAYVDLEGYWAKSSN
ncbi:15955_t:CDS:2, partial [Racocetra fulgida]